MKTDRELLELAAMAAGIPIERSRLDDPMWRDMLVETSNRNEAGHAIGWNPLTDDGDALRLAVKLRLDILRTEIDVEAIAGLPPHVGSDPHHTAAPFGLESIGDDPYVATRRAIVRAAAAIGELMK